MGINEYIKIGQRMKALRKEKGIKLQDMAKQLHIPKSTYANYEADRREPPADIIERFCSILGITLLDLLGNYDPKTGKYLGTPDKIKLNNYYDSLNEDGKQEAVKRVEELTYIEKYTKED